jgi:hypothetical protein
MAANAREFRPLSELQYDLPARAEDDPAPLPERRSAEVVRLLPHGYPMRVRVTPPQESAAASELKPPSGSGEH